MHIGLIVLVVAFIVRALKREGGGKLPLQQKVSFRTVIRVIFFIATYLNLAFILAVPLSTLPIRLQSKWLINITQWVGSGIFLMVLLRWGPPWLAWRICRPFRLFFLGRSVYWFTFGTKERESERFETLLRVAQRRISKHPPATFSPDAWTTATHALLWEIRGDFHRADNLLQAFDFCSPGIKTSRILRRYAFEELAWHAAKRGTWEAVQLRAGQGVGRGARFFGCLAEMHLQHRVNRTTLLLTWLVAPLRLRTWPFVRLLIGRGADNGMKMPGPTQAVRDKGPRRTHLDLLYKASQGRPVAMAEVFLLAEEWDAQWTRFEKENLLRRGMELRVRDVLTTTQTIEAMVLDELEELAAAADGAIPQEIVARMTDVDSSHVTRLNRRIRSRLYDDLNRAQALITVEKEQPLSEDELQEYWENWLGMQATVSRLCQILGPDELGTLWYGGLRSVAWNGAASIYNGCGKRVSWIAIIMFYWVATISQQVGDKQAETVNRNNMTICGYTAPGRFRTSLFRAITCMRLKIRAKG